jgi:hypothetical protein
LAVPRVPANVTAPDVPVLGVNPLSDVWNVVTAPDTLKAAALHAEPVQIYN